jgi:hypothetical protein
MLLSCIDFKKLLSVVFVSCKANARIVSHRDMVILHQQPRPSAKVISQKSQRSSANTIATFPAEAFSRL